MGLIGGSTLGKLPELNKLDRSPIRINLMPFTPFHMGPGLLIKALLQGSFSLMIFGWTQIVMDIQPLVAMITNQGTLHGFTHTYLGAVLIAVIAALTGKHVSEFVLSRAFPGQPHGIPWWIVLLSAFIGSFSHVLLDSLMHADMAPWAPLSQDNALLALISAEAVYRLCLYAGVTGAVLYFVIRFIIARQHKNNG